jgi:hypothetical protein
MLMRTLCVGMTLMTTAITTTGFAATFEEDVEFLRKHTEIIVLSDSSGQAKVAVAPGYQGRVMTSTSGGASGGASFGWINRELIASGKKQPHINVFGGEDRFWLGPEGGQFSIYFKQGDPFDLAHWQVPEAIDWSAWSPTRQKADEVSFSKPLELTNYSGTQFKVRFDRTVRIVDMSAAEKARRRVAASLRMVAYDSVNTITNTGDKAWTKETGLLSIWILGMFNPSPETTIVVPFAPAPGSEPVVNDTYFGKVPADRLKVADGVIYFRGDGQYRSKIGLSPRRATNTLGSYNARDKVLTIVQFSRPKDATDYVNSMWEIQKQPFAGDAVNSYNDGPPAPGSKPLGPFYELETSSPAAALTPGESLTHTHRTIHVTGDEKELDTLAKSTLGVSLEQIKAAFGRP